MGDENKLLLLSAVTILGVLGVLWFSSHRRSLFSGGLLPGGQGEGLRPQDVDPRQLRVGTRVEMEHTRDRRVAQEIALDHLAEDPRYYSKLCQWQPSEAACKLF